MARLTYRKQKARISLLVVVVAALLGAATILWLTRSSGGRTDDHLMRSYGCDVTRPNGKRPPGVEVAANKEADASWHGEKGFWINLDSRSTIVAVKRPPPPPGTYPGRFVGRQSVYAKLGWRRQDGLVGLLRVSATRVDAKSARAKVTLASDYNSAGSSIVPGSLVFPTPGCWRLDAKQGNRTLKFFVAVVRPPLSSGR